MIIQCTKKKVFIQYYGTLWALRGRLQCFQLSKGASGSKSVGVGNIHFSPTLQFLFMLCSPISDHQDRQPTFKLRTEQDVSNIYRMMSRARYSYAVCVMLALQRALQNSV
jgi:hypothetical protein